MKFNEKKVLITSVATLIAFFSVVYTSCKKKEEQAVVTACTNVVCLNNGNCIDGKCYCIPGFEGEKCATNSRDRYIGVWQITDSITGSSLLANKNKTRTYSMTIKKQDGTNIAMLFDGFMGNNTYNGIISYAGKKYDNNSKQYFNEAGTKFAFVVDQNIPGTYITITSGSGVINDLGLNLNGSYTLRYLENGVIVTDTISFYGQPVL